MSECKKCGTECADNEKICPSCGTALENNEEHTEENTEEQNGFGGARDFTSEYDEQDIKANKAFSVCSYLGFLVLIPMFARADSGFARFHANQGLVLFLGELVAAIVSALLWVIPVVGRVLSLLIGLPFYLITVVYMIMGIINASKGRAKELAFIGKINILK